MDESGKGIKPDWWPKEANFNLYKHFTHNNILHNKNILLSVLEYFHLNGNTHCRNPEPVEKKTKRKHRIEKLIERNESEEEDDNITDDLDITRPYTM